jgi:subtilase family serine protease
VIRRSIFTLLALAASGALAACSAHGPSAVTGIPSTGGSDSPAFTGSLGFPHAGTAVHVCPPVSNGFARCASLIRTDVAPHLAGPAVSGYGPSNLRTAYSITASGSSSTTVAVVDAYNDPSANANLKVYRSNFGLAACTVGNGCFKVARLSGAPNDTTGWSLEESLDVDMVSGICPKCHIILVEAKSNSFADLAAAEVYATAHAKYVSNSWSGSEGITTYDGDFNVAGVAITAATGDSGYNSPAGWPAILPTVTGVGGTTLTSVSPRTETSWAGAGSGCSAIYAKPSYQTMATGCNLRAESDVSADANPSTGVAVYDTYLGVGGWVEVGGTSVATPIIASVFALKNVAADNNNTHVYANTAHLNDIIAGPANGGCGAPLCVPGVGWDGPTGLGTPHGVGAF